MVFPVDGELLREAAGKFEAVSTGVKAQTGGTRVAAQTRLQPWVKVAPRPDIAEMYRHARSGTPGRLRDHGDLDGRQVA